MAGNEEINRVGIELYVDDQTATGIDQATSHITAKLEDVGNSIEGNLGKASQGYLADTAKGASNLATKFGSATDASNMMGKTINRVTNMFNPFNIGLGLVIGAVGSLVAAIKQSFEAFDKYAEKMQDMIDKTQKFIDSDKEMTRKRLMTEAGFGEKQFEAEKLSEEAYKVEEEYKKAKAALGEFYTTSVAEIEAGAIVIGFQDELERREAIVASLKRQTEELKATAKARLEESEAARRAKIEEGIVGFVKSGTGIGSNKTKGAGRTKVEDYSGIIDAGDALAMMNAQTEREQQDAIDRLRRKKEEEEKITEITTSAAEKRKAYLDDLRYKEIQARQKLGEDEIAYEKEKQEEMLRIERETAQRRMEIIDGLGGAALTLANMGGRIASSVAKTEKAKAKAEATTAVIIASINAALEVARAISSYPDFVGMAAHAAGAAAYIAAAVLAAKYGGGTPATSSAKGAGGGGGREAFGPPSNGEETRGVTIVIQGHVFSPEGGADFVKRAMEASEDQTNPGRTRRDVR